VYFDIAMPLTLFAVTLVSLFANLKTETKLKDTLQERQLSVRDAVLLVGLMAVMIYLVFFVRQISLILMALFLFSFSMLMFMFTYLFSKNRWYVAVLPPTVFILLYVFLRDTSVWVYVLANIYGLVFAVLITLYLASLFSWKTTAIFGVLVTIMDIMLVFVTGTMIEAVDVIGPKGLRLPVIISLPPIPPVPNIITMGLGLGDFFFAGLLGVQTFKRYGKRFAIVSVIGMTVSFFLFEILMLNYLRIPFAGTLMIICGWAPLVIGKEVAKKKPVTSATQM